MCPVFVSVALFHTILFAAPWVRQKLCDLGLLLMLLLIHFGHDWKIIESALKRIWCRTQITGRGMTTTIFMELLRLLGAFVGLLGRNVLLVEQLCCLFAWFAISTICNICALRTEGKVYHPRGLDVARWWYGCHFHMLTHLWTVSLPHVMF